MAHRVMRSYTLDPEILGPLQEAAKRDSRSVSRQIEHTFGAAWPLIQWMWPDMGFIYRFYNAEDECLYVGQTLSMSSRIIGHRNDKSWWDEVQRIEATRVEGDLSVAEVEEIARLKPKYNKTRGGSKGVSHSGKQVRAYNVSLEAIELVRRTAEKYGVSQSQVVHDTLRAALFGGPASNTRRYWTSSG